MARQTTGVNTMKTSLILTCCICAICGFTFAGTRASTNYSITTETVDSAGVNAQSANYSLHGSAVGEFAAGNSEIITTANYTDKLDYVGQLSDMLDPIAAGSQLSHGSAGTFNVNLPLFVGPRGVECRIGPTDRSYTVVFTFGNPLTSVGSVSASATGGGPAPGATGVIDSSDAHRYVVTLTNVPNAQYTTVALTNVMDSDANFSAALSTQMGVLIGDVNASGHVDAGDIGAIQQVNSQSANSTNFRADVNASGHIDAGDIGVTQSNNSTGLLPPP
jgi:hypothetical protein